MMVCLPLQEFLDGLAVLRSDLINSSSSSGGDTSTTTADTTSTLSINARLAAYESALVLLSCQLEQLVAGAAAVKGALAAAGLLPGDRGSIRHALQQATAAGKLADWASKGKACSKQTIQGRLSRLGDIMPIEHQ
jgi:hypothetical protein